jgi:hypothetical protein
MDWQKAHEALSRLARARAEMDFEEGRWLRAALAAGVHRRLGYGSFTEYVERLFGYAPRLTHEKLRVAEALELLPVLSKALGDGALSWSAVRELTRVATAESEVIWLKAAKVRTVREVERLVSGRRLRDLPEDPRDAGAGRHVLRFEVSGEVLATFREAMTQLRRETGGSLDDEAALLLMARRVLAGESTSGENDECRASYQMAFTVCAQCQRAAQVGGGESIEVERAVAEMARCDAQVLPKYDAPTETHVGAVARATQTIPPALRRAVPLRDQHRCQVPGCRHAAFVDLHHLQTRESGGRHEPDNLLTLCGAHHRAAHRGELSIEGQVSSGVSFRHADGTSYGGVVAASVVAVRTKAFQALRALGFGEREAQRALLQVLTQVGNDAELEVVVRAALAALTEQVLAQAS